MMPGIGVVRGVPTRRNLEEQMERQMGCMTGFVQLFDRHQLLTGRRFYSTKRLPSSLGVGSTSPSAKSEISTASLIKDALDFPFSPSPDVSPENHVPMARFSGRPTLPLPVFEIKDGLKGSRKLPEAPRLSLDSRANVDAKGKLCPREIQTSPVVFTSSLSEASEDRDNQGKQRRSPSVVARLMGLEELPVEEPQKRPELRRSASESRVTRESSQFNFQNQATVPSETDFKLRKQDYHATRSRDPKPETLRQTPGLFQRKSFEAQEIFPEAKRVGQLSGEIEKRRRMRGAEEPARDLETLKQILEALQLKGLLHSKQEEHSACFNDLHEHRSRFSSAVQAPIVVIKPVPKPPPTLHSRPMPARRNPSPEPVAPTRIQRELEIERSFRRESNQSSTRLQEPSLGSMRRSPRKVEGRSSPLPQRRLLPAHSPKPSPKKLGSGQTYPPKHRRPTTHISPKVVCSTAEDDPSTSLSDNGLNSRASIFELESEDYSSGRRLLERCDKLLHSIAAITSTAEQVIPAERQLSPVSVLDSSFNSDECSTSLPKLAIGFNDQLTNWPEDHSQQDPTPTTEPDHPSLHLQHETTTFHNHHPQDYVFILNILHEFDLGRSGDEAFASISNHHLTATSSPPLHRRLVFDAVTELVNRKRHFSPWDTFSGALAPATATSLVSEVWEELRQKQERLLPAAADAMEATCSLIRKEMVGGSGSEKEWGIAGEEMSEAVLHIERLVFKDLVADTIRDLADLTGRCRFSRRKLVF